MVDEMAGPEMDALVAKSVMGWHSFGDHWATSPAPKTVRRECKKMSWQPSTNIDSAWRVFEQALILTGYVNVTADMEDWGRGTFTADGPEKVITVTVGFGPSWTVTAPFPLAICRAALAAVEATT